MLDKDRVILIKLLTHRGQRLQEDWLQDEVKRVVIEKLQNA